ncbi:UDP-N-acetylmuramate--L-alanine ligase [Patescibacteria group bacterium]|nr:UDP-N-acetylmuramate--L-alanine ligase [Patescibacteria group bacterium]
MIVLIMIEMDFLKKYKKIYISGIAGSGTSALAGFLFENGIEVIGSDTGNLNMLSELEIKFYNTQEASNIDDNIDLLIYSSAVLEDNPERIRAKELKIPEMTYFQALGEISENFYTIAVAGTNGKTTTTSISSILLSNTTLDPSVIVGAKVLELDNKNYKKGTSNILIVEACEYMEHFLYLNPNVLTITNIEAEHLDYYKTLENVILAFEKMINKIPDGGVIIYNKDDENTRELIKKVSQKRHDLIFISYGINEDSDFIAKFSDTKDGVQIFETYYNREFLAEFRLSIPGKFNIYNTLASLSTCFTISKINKLRHNILDWQYKILNFRGSNRRFEIIKKDIKKDIIYVLDYAHHPTSINQIIIGAKRMYDLRRIFVIFQPHTFNRTKNLFSDFIKCFDYADFCLISDIYEPTGRDIETKNIITSKELVKSIKKRNPKLKVKYSGDLVKTSKKMKKNLKNKDLVLILGAGDIFTLNID